MEPDFWGIARKFPEFSRGDIEVFIESFQQFDADKSGTIDKNELTAALKTMGQGASEDDVQRLFKVIDADNSGTIDFQEWLQMMRYFFPWKVLAYIEDFIEPARAFPEFTANDIEVFTQTFREFDEDDSGTIDLFELGKLLKSMGQGCSEEQLRLIMKQFDADGSGDIDWAEFLQIMRTFYPSKRFEYIRTYLEPARAFPEFSKSDIEAFVHTFREFDLDGNGSIDADELGIAFRRMGQGITPEGLKKLIQEVDRDNNGTVEWPEFLAIMRKFYPHKRDEYEKKYYEPAKKFPEFSRDDVDVFVQAFRDFDLDGNGSIDADELALVFRSMGQGCTPERLKAIIQEVDQDGNGTIEFGEFLAIMKNMYFGGSSSATATSSSGPSSPATAAAKPSPQKQSSGVGFGGHRPGAPSPSNKCASCGKTVYPTEAINALNQMWHKGCFKCTECKITLTLKNFVGHDNQPYCTTHVPKAKASSVTVEGSLTMQSAVSAPKRTAVQGVKKDARTTFAPGQLKPVNPDEQPDQ